MVNSYYRTLPRAVPLPNPANKQSAEPSLPSGSPHLQQGPHLGSWTKERNALVTLVTVWLILSLDFNQQVLGTRTPATACGQVRSRFSDQTYMVTKLFDFKPETMNPDYFLTRKPLYFQGAISSWAISNRGPSCLRQQ